MNNLTRQQQGRYHAQKRREVAVKYEKMSESGKKDFDKGVRNIGCVIGLIVFAFFLIVIIIKGFLNS
ncbi:MAG: hypothetical protein JW798_00005 [Prolixibacteraceae bacterium]|nr:hypothetical protein [Prolixibacteraceae bacterium]